MYRTALLIAAGLLACADFAPAQDATPKPAGKKLKVCLVSGALEYKSDESLAAYQAELEKNHAVECVRAFRDTDTNIPGLEALETCDVTLFFTRRLTPTAEQLDRVKKYVASGKPVVGVRTASHGFQNWLEMDALVFGGDYKGHHKHMIEAAVTPVKGVKHPILDGVQPFKTMGGLYKNAALAADTTVLLTGTADGKTEPVAWVRERKIEGGPTQRVFYTSLGTADDFKNPDFVRLLTNGLMWAAGK